MPLGNVEMLTLGGCPMRGFDRVDGRRARSIAGPESWDKAATCTRAIFVFSDQLWHLTLSGRCPDEA